ncbi:nuclease A inhibitor family protein [Adhaeribacter sp. BT258]|uniref:Nuclease A inhibitor family protein n=1 Tax=Adhaeribacter terrigena TaxID=2793070 RepID=A0ABS1BZ60_9BACT|nr:nuclease A inhibitor family protein [Adhaeribacter terrigena]MBK0402431.1 nuclease A inhibitor family protein [Adhaeribacter terrigena]
MENTLDKLKKASAGLLFMSESDYPFETVSFPAGKLLALDEESVKQALNLPAEAGIEKQELTYFLRNQTRELPEFSEEDKARAQRFRELENVLKQELKDVAVFRTGQTQIDAYVLGKMADGSTGGLKTRLIET